MAYIHIIRGVSIIKTFVSIFGIANVISGGLIYNCNKIRYMKENGWIVNVLPTNTGSIYIEPLKEYADLSFPFLQSPPYVFPKEKIEEYLDILISAIDISEEILIETGTDYTALWGELLAERLHAKHIIFFLDEKNNRITKNVASFYKFKYERNELASISLESLNFIFGKYFDLNNPESHVLLACCSNVVEDVKSNLKYEIPKGDYTIGSIGRLDKEFVPIIVDSICKFANKVPDKIVAVCFFGGANKSIEKQIKEEMSKIANIKCYISGYIWPIPQDVFSEIDVFISAAGSIRVSANQNKPTIGVDVISFKPRGILIDIEQYKFHVLNKKDLTICDYLSYILIKKEKIFISGVMPIQAEWNWISSCFKRYLLFYKNSSSIKAYYPTEKLWDGTFKTIIKKFCFRFLGEYRYYLLKNKVSKWRKVSSD